MIRFLAALALACALNGCHPAFAATVRELEPVIGTPWSSAVGAGLAITAVLAVYSAGLWVCTHVRWPALVAPVVVIAIFWGIAPALADPACPQAFLGDRAPVLVTPQPDAIELRSEAFTVLWSPSTRDPIYAAERLTPACLTKADHEVRVDAFHADDRLPHGARAELSDYAGGAFDRGHLAPAHDMPNPAAMRESFALSNMAPQVPSVNRGAWAQVEIFTRRLAILGDGAYVVTALAFDPHLSLLNGRVAIPGSYVKAVYVPPGPFNPQGQVGAYAVANAAGARPEVISLDEMTRRTGVDPFPSLSAADHARVDLPAVAEK